MPSDKAVVDHIREQLSGVFDVLYRAMMGETILYYRGKVVGGVYDNRLLIKPTPSAKRLLPDARLELPYPGAKEMLLVERTEDRAFLSALLNAVYEDLPAKNKR